MLQASGGRAGRDGDVGCQPKAGLHLRRRVPLASHLHANSQPKRVFPQLLCSNVHVMREQLERAEARARQAEELLPDAADLQGQLAAAEQQLGRWRVILDGAADCACPEDVLHLLTSLQKQQMEAAVQVGVG